MKSNSVISGRWLSVNERLCAMESRLRMKIFLPPEIELGTARSAGQRLVYLASRVSESQGT